MSKSRKPTYPLPPPKKPGPQRPAPPLYGKNSSSGVHSQGFGAPAVRKTHMDRGPVSSSSTLRSAVNPPSALTDFRALGSETQQLEWAKRESQREEAERIRRLRLQEQQELELALALSQAEMPRT
ncbi:epidermal growth factor receptor substrate 15-like 1 [Sinocyclocheilus grahami]|uniref:epidermal growth factor receptor substrate 15-like 1 n=1 Tax=Sinocyclocheilus grahami TaxID=75366 RepID=UPI0007AD1196|nr:PREDICTED: epidermal growth factor receptor substrate 15-like 1 [Sinocyclocheilus grahami]